MKTLSYTVTFSLVSFLLLRKVMAWGALGHMTVGAIASNFLHPATVIWTQNLLDIHDDTYLASVGPWADQYRETSAGEFSKPFHFIDAEDSPPTACSCSYIRDCGKSGCLASAILNYTQRVQDTTLSTADRAQALKFLVHFLGDVTQPLHNEYLLRGANEIDVKFGTVSTNLHAIWDTNMPEKLVGGYQPANAMAWGANLTKEIVSGIYASQSGSWVRGVDLSDPVSSTMLWSIDANAFVCSYVLAQGVDALIGKDLSGAYYEGAVPIFELQIAKGGYRLATWLNLIANATPALSASSQPATHWSSVPSSGASHTHSVSSKKPVPKPGPLSKRPARKSSVPGKKAPGWWQNFLGIRNEL